ncbi:MAG: CvpA family protein, partial [Rhodothermales bacterium]
MSIQSLDILIIILLVVGIVRGFMKGAIRQALGLVGSVLAVILGLEFMHPMGQAIAGLVGLSEPLYAPVGFIAIFAAVEILVFLLSRTLESLLRVMKLTVVNRAMGGVLGLAKTVLILSVLFLVLGLFDVPEAENRQSSILYRPVATVFPSTWDFAARHLPYVRGLSERFGSEVSE